MAQKNIRRTNQRVREQQINSRENADYYQNGREWATESSESAIRGRRSRISAAVGQPVFVHGIKREGSIFDA